MIIANILHCYIKYWHLWSPYFIIILSDGIIGLPDTFSLFGVLIGCFMLPCTGFKGPSHLVLNQNSDNTDPYIVHVNQNVIISHILHSESQMRPGGTRDVPGLIDLGQIDSTLSMF